MIHIRCSSQKQTWNWGRRPGRREQSGELEAASNNRGPIWKGTRLPGTTQAKTQLTTLPGVCLYHCRPSTGFERREAPGVAGRGFSYRGTERKLIRMQRNFQNISAFSLICSTCCVPHMYDMSDMSMHVLNKVHVLAHTLRGPEMPTSSPSLRSSPQNSNAM